MRENFSLVEDKGRIRNEKGGKTYHDRGEKDVGKKHESVPSYYYLLLLGFLFLIGVFTAMIDDSLPDPVTEGEAGYKRFSEERSWRYLKEIVGTGPRVAGTKYHLEKTIDMKNIVDGIANKSNVKIHTDWQIVTGDYWLAARRPFINAYGNLSNIIAVLEGESGLDRDGNTNSSILFNCHYDTVPTSPGASDNGLFCAAMLEVLSIFSKNTQKFKHNIIFLFNGAEENPLQGASGFLKHPWSKGITALVNLDAAGTNCKSMLFQVSDPRVVRAYAAVTERPSAQAIGEVLFSAGIIPSDTDFRVFRDFAQIYGVDIAFSKVGHVYHTRHDSLETIASGVLQHSGDMLLNVARYMADSDLFHTKAQTPETLVYWDYLNIVMFHYDFDTALLVDGIIAAFGVASVLYYLSMVGYRRSTIKELLISSVLRVVAAAMGVVAVVSITALMVLFAGQLRYLSNSWLVVPMFWFPFLVGSVLMSHGLDRWRSRKCGLNRIRRVSQAQASTRLLMSAATIVLLFVHNSATMRYIVTVPLVLMSLSAFVSITCIKRFKFKAYQQLLLEVLLCLPAQMFFFVMAVKINTLMLPIMGRSPTLKPDYLVAILNVGMVLLSSIPLSGVELLYSRTRLWLPVLVTALICIAVWVIPTQNYNDARRVLQRHYWFHSEITSYDYANRETDRRTGIWLAHTEVNTPQSVMEHARASGLRLNASQFVDLCTSHAYCDMPTFTPRTIEHVNNSIWVDWSAPSVSTPKPEFVLKGKKCHGNLCTFNFTVNGPPHQSIIVWPRDNITVLSWSFESPVEKTTVLLNRPVYYVYYSRATYRENPLPLEFNLAFDGITSEDMPIVDLSFISHRIQHPEEFTASYRKLTESMPEYFNIATFISSRFNYIF